MNSVIRNARLRDAPTYFGREEPRFVDERAAELIEQARATAFEEGRRVGYAQGVADSQNAVIRLETALAEAHRLFQHTHRDALAESIDVALTIAEFVLGADPREHHPELPERIHEALSAIDDEDVVVMVHPSDWDAVAPAVALPSGVAVERDESLQPGEARIRGRWSSVDMTHRAALEVIREALS